MYSSIWAKNNRQHYYSSSCLFWTKHLIIYIQTYTYIYILSCLFQTKHHTTHIQTCNVYIIFILNKTSHYSYANIQYYLYIIMFSDFSHIKTHIHTYKLHDTNITHLHHLQSWPNHWMLHLGQNILALIVIHINYLIHIDICTWRPFVDIHSESQSCGKFLNNLRRFCTLIETLGSEIIWSFDVCNSVCGNNTRRL